MAGALPTILAGTPQTNHDQMAGVPDHPKLAGAPQSKYTLVAGALPTTMGKVRDVRRGVFYWDHPVFPAPFSWISPAFTSPPSLSVLSSRQGWGCKCSVFFPFSRACQTPCLFHCSLGRGSSVFFHQPHHSEYHGGHTTDSLPSSSPPCRCHFHIIAPHYSPIALLSL
jgi:hypothetical protein